MFVQFVVDSILKTLNSDIFQLRLMLNLCGGTMSAEVILYRTS